MYLFEGTEKVYEAFRSKYTSTCFYVAKQQNGKYALYEKCRTQGFYHLITMGKKNIKNWLIENSEFLEYMEV